MSQCSAMCLQDFPQSSAWPLLLVQAKTNVYFTSKIVQILIFQSLWGAFWWRPVPKSYYSPAHVESPLEQRQTMVNHLTTIVRLCRDLWKLANPLEPRKTTSTDFDIISHRWYLGRFSAETSTWLSSSPGHPFYLCRDNRLASVGKPQNIDVSVLVSLHLL